MSNAMTKVTHRDRVRLKLEQFRQLKKELQREVMEEVTENGIQYWSIEEIVEVMK